MLYKVRKVAMWAGLLLIGCSSTIIILPSPEDNRYGSAPFDPYAYNPKTLEELDELPLSDQDRWTWLRYRRAEIGVCFEDEYLDEFGHCQVEDE